MHACTWEDTDGRHRRRRPAAVADPLTRNWDKLLQEMRVTQTGVQILTGFLLTVPFSTRFDDLTAFSATSTSPCSPGRC